MKIDIKAISEILVADIDLKSGAEVSDLGDELAEQEEEGTGGTTVTRTKQQALAEEEPQVATRLRMITNLGTAFKKEHKFYSIYQTSKRCNK
jgi:hypothetical protein